MNIYKQVITLVSFAFVYSHAYAMDNNKPKPPSALNFNGTLKPTEFKSTLNWGGTLRPTEFKSVSSKPVPATLENESASAPTGSTEIVAQRQYNFQSAECFTNVEQKNRNAQEAIDQFVVTTSHNNAQAVELVAAVFEKLSQDKQLNAEEIKALSDRMKALQLKNKEAIQQAHDAVKKSLN